jgi:hypothetical protein
MKVSSSDDDTIIIQFEKFEAGKKPFSLPRISLAEFVYLVFILTITYLSGFNPLAFLVKIESSTISYWESHPLNSIVYSTTFLILFFSRISDIFFKKFVIRRDGSYKIDKDSYFSAHPPYSLSQKIEKISYEEIFNAVSLINKIHIVEDFKIGVTYDEESGSAAAYAIASYAVVIELGTGKHLTVESGSINTLTVGNDNQVAFNKLVLETKIAVEHVKSFLAASKN